MMRHILDELRNLHAVSRIEARVDFVKHVKRHGITLLDGKNQGKRDDTLLASREKEIVHGLTIIHPRESNFDANSRPSL